MYSYTWLPIADLPSEEENEFLHYNSKVSERPSLCENVKPKSLGVEAILLEPQSPKWSFNCKSCFC